MGLEDDFKVAAEEAKALPKATNDEILSLYALFKQANEGDVTIARPGILDQKGRVKWDAWEKVKGKSKEDAQTEYIALVAELKAKYAA